MQISRIAPPRIRNWDVQLVLWAREQIGKPFEWGRTDCASLTRGALAVMYGTDPLTAVFWSDLRSALSAIEGLGGAAAALQRLGAQPCPLKFAQAGDIAVGPERDAHGLVQLSVVLGRGQVLVTTPEHGVAVASIAALTHGTECWRVPA